VVSGLDRPRRRSRRTQQRGAALLVVLLVITLLMGIGTMAARSTRLNVSTSGNERRMTQARYVAEYGLLIMQSKLSNGLGEAYIKAMSTPTAGALCTGQAAAGMSQPTCLKVFYQDVQTELFNQGFNVCEAATPTTPGSLGLAGAQCDFDIELTDKSAGMPPPGQSLSNGGNMGSTPLRFWYVTASVTGWVRLTGAMTTAGVAESSTNQLLRSRIVAGPYF
jgi:hypothetical protein